MELQPEGPQEAGTPTWTDSGAHVRGNLLSTLGIRNGKAREDLTSTDFGGHVYEIKPAKISMVLLK